MGIKDFIIRIGVYVVILSLMGCDSTDTGRYGSLQKDLMEFTSGKDAKIGIAVIIDRTDTVSANGDRAFPMLSVYKLPIALALAENYRTQGLAFDNPVEIHKEESAVERVIAHEKH